MQNEPIIALSTSFFHGKISDAYEMMQKAAEMGFKYVELGHTTTVSMVDGIEQAVGEGVIKVSSLHNFCPIPPFATPPAPNFYSPATASKRESAQWLRHTKNTVNFAERVGASRVVTHAGELSYFWGSPKFKLGAEFAELLELRAEISERGEEAGELKEKLERLELLYKRDIADFIKKSERKSRKAHDRIFENLKDINEQLKEKNLLLGVENRDGYCELPFDTKFAEFAKRESELSNVRAWIDIGHVAVKSLRGVIDFEKFVEESAPYICGWHLHDCTAESKDHKALGQGCINFDFVKKYFDAEKHVFTLELSPKVRTQEAVDSRLKLEDMFA